MPNMRKDKRLTSSATRSARGKGNAGGSQPRPRPTQVSSMKQQGPLKPKATTTASERGGNTGTARVTSSNRPQSPRLPNLPKNPVKGTTYTIRATGGRSTDPKINRLSAQAAKPTPKVLPKGPKIAPSSVTKAVSSALSLRKLTPMGVAYETLKARPTANGELAYNQKLVAQMMKKKKKGQ